MPHDLMRRFATVCFHRGISNRTVTQATRNGVSLEHSSALFRMQSLLEFRDTWCIGNETPAGISAKSEDSVVKPTRDENPETKIWQRDETRVSPVNSGCNPNVLGELIPSLDSE